MRVAAGAFSGWWIFSRPTVMVHPGIRLRCVWLVPRERVRPWLRQAHTANAGRCGSLPFPRPRRCAAGCARRNQSIRSAVGRWARRSSLPYPRSPEAQRSAGSRMGPSSAGRRTIPAKQQVGPEGALVGAHSQTSPVASESMPYRPFELRVAGKEVASPSVFYPGGRDYVWFSAAQDARLLDVRLGKPVGEWQDTYAGWEWNGKLPRRPERVISHAGQEAVVSWVRLGQHQARELRRRGLARRFQRNGLADSSPWTMRVSSTRLTVDTTPLRGPVPAGAWRGEQAAFRGLAPRASRNSVSRFAGANGLKFATSLSSRVSIRRSGLWMQEPSDH